MSIKTGGKKVIPIKVDKNLNNSSLYYESNVCFKEQDYSPSNDKMPDDEDHPEECCVNIDMLRTGKFKRYSFFGDFIINIDDKMIDNMIENFENKIVTRGVPLDVNHNKAEAYGWLNSLTKEYREINGKNQVFLIGNWSLNEKGQKLIKDKSYKYFSIEFDPNYEKTEVDSTIKTPEGMEVQSGESFLYGPTILGGALTNRPFIPDMNSVPMTFSDEEKYSISKNLITFEDKESGGLDKGLLPLSGKDNNIVNETKNSVSIFANLKPLEEKKNMNIIEFMESQLSNFKKDSEEYKSLFSVIEKTKLEFAENQKKISEKEAALQVASEANKKLTEQFGELATKVVALESKVQVSETELTLQKERARHADITQYCSDLTTKGMPKPVVDTVKEILFADRDGKIVMTFGEGDKKESLTVRSVVSKILNSFPASTKVPTGENLQFDIGGRELDNPAKTQVEQFTETHSNIIDTANKKVFSSYKKSKKSSALDMPVADSINSKN